MKKIIDKIDWVLFSILLFAAFVPLIYKSYRLFLVSKMDDETLSLAINWGYIYMIFESINIFVIVPSYWFIKRNANSIEESNRNMIIILLFTSLIFIVSIFVISLFGLPIAYSSYIELDSSISKITFIYIYKYIVIYGVSLSVHLFINVMIVYLIVNNKKLQSFLMTIISLLLTLMSDTLFLNINKNASLISISESMFVSSILSLILISILIYFVDTDAWKKSFSLVTKNNLLEGWKVYAKNGMWLGMEAFIWNIFNALGVFTWFLVCKSGDVETSFWIMDGLFWGFLLLPSTAVSMFTAEGISNEDDKEGKKDVIKLSMFLSFLTLVSWIIFVPLLILFLIPNLLNETETIIKMSQTMCLVFVGFIAIQVPTKVIYTYFSTTNRSYYLTIGSALGASLTWGLSFITLLILYFTGLIDDGISNDIAQIVIPIIYGLGILLIFVFYIVFYILTLNDDEDAPNLIKRFKMKSELIKASALSEK